MSIMTKNETFAIPATETSPFPSYSSGLAPKLMENLRRDALDALNHQEYKIAEVLVKCMGVWRSIEQFLPEQQARNFFVTSLENLREETKDAEKKIGYTQAITLATFS